MESNTVRRRQNTGGCRPDRSSMADRRLSKKISHLQQVIRRWMGLRKLEPEFGFKSWIERFAEEPGESPVVLVLWYENELRTSFSLQNDLLAQVCAETEFEGDPHDENSIWFFVRENNALRQEYHEYFQWQWTLHLIESSYFDLHEELYVAVAGTSGRLQELPWRKFEELLDSIFRNNGYRTELEKGRDDRGVDIRLYRHDIVGEVLTLVQAKCYAEDRAVSLEAVMALSAAVDAESANRGILVTSARYLPSAKKFADRRLHRLILADSSDIAAWSGQAAEQVRAANRSSLSDSHVLEVLSKATLANEGGLIVCASVGVKKISNDYALVLKEVGSVALLMRIPSRVVDGDSTSRYNMPLLERPQSLSPLDSPVFRALKRRYSDGAVYYQGDHHEWRVWDGRPVFFDHTD